MYNIFTAGMAKLVYALDLESSEVTRAGSSPVASTRLIFCPLFHFFEFRRAFYMIKFIKRD